MKGIAGPLPVIVAGDVLHRWNEPVEFLNFLVSLHRDNVLPHLHAVAGNHDLPNHSLAEIRRSGYTALKESGVLTNIRAGESLYFGRDYDGLQVTGWPHGSKVVGPRRPLKGFLQLATIHDLIYAKEPFPGVDPENQQCAWVDRKLGYDVMHFGDNHRPLYLNRMGVEVFNSGAFICRRADERQHKPRVGLLDANGKVTNAFMDVSGDKWVDALSDGGHDEEPVGQDFADALLETSGVADDFADAVAHYARKHKGEITKGTRRLLVRIMEESRE